MKVKSFTEFLYNDEGVIYEQNDNIKNVITFTFFDMLLPDEEGSLLEVDEFLKKYPKISLQQTQNGIQVIFTKQVDETVFYTIDDTENFINENPEGTYTLYIKLLKLHK